MALINCPECGGKISSTVDTCLHCGYKLTSEVKYEKGIISEEEYLKILGGLPYAQSMPLYEKLASQGNLAACKLIAKSYFEGWNGYTKNFTKAKEYYSRFESTDNECKFYLARIFDMEHEGQNSEIIAKYKELLEIVDFPIDLKGLVLNNISFCFTDKEERKKYRLMAYEIAKNYVAARNLLDDYIEQRLYDKAITFGERVLTDTNIPLIDKGKIMNYVGVAYYRKNNDYLNANKYYFNAYECDRSNGQYVCNYLDSCIVIARESDESYYQKAIEFGEPKVYDKRYSKEKRGLICCYLGLAYEEKTPSDLSEALQHFYTGKLTYQNTECKGHVERLENKSYSGGPCCPHCWSSDVSKIGMLNKAASIGFFGIFAAGHVSKTYKCNSCGCKF